MISIKPAARRGIKPLVGMEFRNNEGMLYICIAKNRQGLGEICRFRTAHNFSGKPLPVPAPAFENVAVIYPLEGVREVLQENEYIGMRADQLTQLYQNRWRERIGRMVVLHPVTHRNQKGYKLHKVLRAIDNNVVVTRLAKADICRPDEQMIPFDHLPAKFFHEPEILVNTEKLIDACNFEYDFSPPKNCKHFTDNKEVK